MIDCNAITLRIGSEIYITPDHESSNTHTKQTLSADQAFAIPPGQFAFLVSDEVITISPETMGFISFKAKSKLRGLVNVSGFHVDPGWSGSLVFAVFNAGPAPVHLQRGQPLFLLWIADLDAASEKHKSGHGPTGLPPDMINNITGAVGSIDELATLIREEVKNLSKKDEELSDRMHSMEKLQHRVLLGLGILSVILVAATTVAVKEAYTSLFENPKVNPVAVPVMDNKASGVPPTRQQ